LYNYKAGIKNAVGLTANADEIGRARIVIGTNQNGYFKNMAKSMNGDGKSNFREQFIKPLASLSSYYFYLFTMI